MTRIFIFRHALSTDGETNTFSGWRNPDLSPQGIEEAKQVREQLKFEAVNKAYTSDLIRCIHTLEIVLEPHKGVQVFQDVRLRERDYGDLTGKNKDEVKRDYPDNFEKWHRSYDTPPPGGESIAQVEERVNKFLDDMVKDAKSEDVIFICASGNSMRPIRKKFEGLSNEEMATFEHIPAKVYSYEI